MTEEERQMFHRNFTNMLLKIGCTPYRINGAGKQGNELPGWEMAPSYSILSRCKNDPDYTPSDETVNKIVRFYNANLTPPTDAYAFRHDDLILSGMTRKAMEVDFGARYLGGYYCYYLSDHYAGEVHGGILWIFRTGNVFRVRLIMSLQEDRQMEDPRLVQVLRENSTLAESRRQFNSYRRQLENTGLKRCYYCEGTLRAFEQSVVMELCNVNNPSHLMILTLNTQKNSIHRRYRGGLGVSLSPSTNGLETRFWMLGLSRFRFSIQDPELVPYLGLHLEKTKRVELTAADDRGWYNMLLKRENEKRG